VACASVGPLLRCVDLTACADAVAALRISVAANLSLRERRPVDVVEMAEQQPA